MNRSLTETDSRIIHQVLVEQLELSEAQLTPEARIIEDLGADSLDIVSISMTLEERLNLLIPDEEWDKVETVADVHEALARLLDRPGTRP